MEVSYSMRLFRSEILTKAVSEFSVFCDIWISDKTCDYWVIQFDNCIFKDRKTVQEFNNYLIELMNVIKQNDPN